MTKSLYDLYMRAIISISSTGTFALAHAFRWCCKVMNLPEVPCVCGVAKLLD